MSLRILIGGGSGFIGRHLERSLQNRGHAVTIISRQLGPNRITWSEIEQKGLPQCDVCIQMSGAGIVDKSWTEHRKSELINSRVHLTALLVKAIQRMPKPPAVFISGSAIGYYPTHAFETFDEDYRGPPAANFAGELCYKWEEASAVLVTQTPAVRRCVLRLGLVLGRDGGLWPKLRLPFGLAYVGPFGSGNQWFPWVHVDDVVNLVHWCIETPQTGGVYNAVAPGIITMAEFAAKVRTVFQRPTIPVPEFMVKLIFRERAFLILEGQKVLPKRTMNEGFIFSYPNIEATLKSLL
jgi:uncharacterized protein (TIGR01777 family)